MTQRKTDAAAATRDILKGAQGAADSAAVNTAQGQDAPTTAAQVQVTVYLDPETAERLTELAEAEDRPISYVARRILREFFH